MYRQYPNTNQRSKEIKVKHVWKLCLFLGVCLWLIYQVKLSHDEKKGFDESDVGKDSEDINDQMEKESSVEETDRDGDDTNSHKSREEHCKADDASSAVSHETRMDGMENENEHDENSNEQVEDILEHGLGENTSEELDEGERKERVGIGSVSW
ncbi:uncharacterized protein LOC142519852 [Primulina tabacum]|uniref:uncharacterized protein LOC142519852 n=1 Tax=Primulina tabacum TaxID=48773 RepID=UPI003F5A8A7A